VKTRNRIPLDPQDIAARRVAFARVRKGIPHAEIARLTGLSLNTVRCYSGPSSPNTAATWTAIEALQAEAVRRARKAVAKAEDTLFRCEIELQRLERMELPPSPVEGKSSLKPVAAVAEGQPQAASRRNFPDLRSSSRNQISPCPSTSSAAGPAQI
jgi:hypothetical protein